MLFKIIKDMTERSIIFESACSECCSLIDVSKKEELKIALKKIKTYSLEKSKKSTHSFDDFFILNVNKFKMLLSEGKTIEKSLCKILES